MVEPTRPQEDLAPVDQSSFRARIGSIDSFATNQASLYELPVVPSGGAPAPFNAVDSLRMSGPWAAIRWRASTCRSWSPGPTSSWKAPSS